MLRPLYGLSAKLNTSHIVTPKLQASDLWLNSYVCQTLTRSCHKEPNSSKAQLPGKRNLFLDRLGRTPQNRHGSFFCVRLQVVLQFDISNHSQQCNVWCQIFKESRLWIVVVVTFCVSPKSATLARRLLSNRTFLAARSRCTRKWVSRYDIPDIIISVFRWTS